MRRPLCQVHFRGRRPGQGVPYTQSCAECVRRRGHLPESERDIPGPTGREFAKAEMRAKFAAHRWEQGR